MSPLHALETNGNEPQLIALTVRVDLRELQLSDNRFTLDTYTARNVWGLPSGLYSSSSTSGLPLTLTSIPAV